MINILDYFSNLDYPGRNITVGKMNDGAIFFCYGIMGRSEHSKNRIFVKERNIVKTKAYNEALLKDPSLIIYNAVIPIKNGYIVTNGDQSDTVLEYLNRKKTFEDALRTRAFENDAPNYTPRISALLKFKEDDLKKVEFSILKRGDFGGVRRFFYDYEKIEPNTAFVINTYSENTNPLKPFVGEPIEVSIPKITDINELTNIIFDSQNIDNRISLYGLKYKKNASEDIIINTNKDN
ncbi:MAG: inosine monophosphate cyclohydrolase [Spirochaetia bacterium]|nr:inosine monophosphate cyclohydrolase [Spirochaetia bacterium]